MALLKKIKVDFSHSDDRGLLVQLTSKGYSQVNVITSATGVFRGGHYHKWNTEAFYIVSGRCVVTASKNGSVEKAEFKAGDFFCIAPYVLHDFQYMEDTVIVSMYSLGVVLDDNTMDIFNNEEVQ